MSNVTDTDLVSRPVGQREAVPALRALLLFYKPPYDPPFLLRSPLHIRIHSLTRPLFIHSPVSSSRKPGGYRVRIDKGRLCFAINYERPCLVFSACRNLIGVALPHTGIVSNGLLKPPRSMSPERSQVLRPQCHRESPVVSTLDSARQP